jgi:hypothetical protein
MYTAFITGQIRQKAEGIFSFLPVLPHGFIWSCFMPILFLIVVGKGFLRYY